MPFDGRKNLQISYNLLNLPQTVNQAGMQMANYYNTTDHLASIRVITDQAGTVAEQNDYYPFGKRTNTGEQYLLMPTNRYKFNGKELQTIANMEYLDYGARFYDPTIARWLTRDPLADDYYSLSPYGYCANNPIIYIDPDGRKIVDANGKPITYSAKTGWSSNVTADVRRIGTAMMATPKGTEMFNKMTNASHNITITIDAGKGDGTRLNTPHSSDRYSLLLSKSLIALGG